MPCYQEPRRAAAGFFVVLKQCLIGLSTDFAMKIAAGAQIAAISS
jgi:hypothetical protein